MARFIFVTGGVISSLGKGLAAASIGSLLQSRNFKVKIRKLDPYLNVDPGTMSPQQHGEVFVTEDGVETDLDLGHYERFTGINASGDDSITAGKIYSDLLNKERKGVYLGSTVQVIPHVTDLIKSFIFNNSDDYDFVICEIGGTVGDIEGQPFLESIRQIGCDVGPALVAYVHLTLIPYVAAAQESKTKPTQHSVRQLNSMGIQPYLILCRSEKQITADQRKKIAVLCSVKEECVIPVYDVENIYQIPIVFNEMQVDVRLLDHFNIKDCQAPDLGCWRNVLNIMQNVNRVVTVGVVGKYFSASDSYKSLMEALKHGGIANNVKVEVKVVDSIALNEGNVHEILSECDGVLVPGGFGDRGIDGKMVAIKYARENTIPFLGICLGMQLVVLEIMRNLVGDKMANSREFSMEGNPVVGMIEEWRKGGELIIPGKNMGATMRLGSYECTLLAGSKVSAIYGNSLVIERHRHRYEINSNYKDKVEAQGFLFSGSYKDMLLEVIESVDHPWFIAVQFHPELKSRPFEPHPLFSSFIKQLVQNKYVVDIT